MNREIIASGSRVGPSRPVNQDRCAHWRGDDIVIALAADGVGGRQAGERASWLVVDTFVQRLGVVGLGHRLSRLRNEPPPGPVTVSAHLPRPVQWVETLLGEANERILDEASTGDGMGGMATTVVVAVVDRRARCCHFCHVGDSRAYMYAGGRLSLMTRDHVEYTPDNTSKRAAVTRALGAHLVLPLEITPLSRSGFPFSPADLLLLCTDGLSGVVPEERIAGVLGSCGESLSDGVEELLLAVEMMDGTDDASLVLVMPISETLGPAADPLEDVRIAPPPPPPRASVTPSQPEIALPSRAPNLAQRARWTPRPDAGPSMAPPAASLDSVTLTDVPQQPARPAALKPVPEAPKPSQPPAKPAKKPPAMPPGPSPSMAPPDASLVGVTVVDQGRLPVITDPEPERPTPAASPPADQAINRPLTPPEPGLPSTDSLEEVATTPPPAPRRRSPIPRVLAVVGSALAIGLFIGFIATAGILFLPRDCSEQDAPRPDRTQVSTPGDSGGGAVTWFDASGEFFVAGTSSPCPAGVVCLEDAGLAGATELGLLQGQATGSGTARRLDTYVRCSRFLREAVGVLKRWHPAKASVEPSSCLSLFPGDRPWAVGLDGAPEPLELNDWNRGSTGPYRISSYSRDLVRAVAEGSRAWELLMEDLAPGTPDPQARIYALRLATASELALVSASLDDIDSLPRVLENAVEGGESLVIRLPSAPMVAFDGHGPFAINSGFRRELSSLKEVAARRSSYRMELCVVATVEPTRAHADVEQWNQQRLGYLAEALGEVGATDELAVCPRPLRIDDLGLAEDECDPYRTALLRQTLVTVSAATP